MNVSAITVHGFYSSLQLVTSFGVNNRKMFIQVLSDQVDV